MRAKHRRAEVRGSWHGREVAGGGEGGGVFVRGCAPVAQEIGVRGAEVASDVRVTWRAQQRGVHEPRVVQKTMVLCRDTRAQCPRGRGRAGEDGQAT